MVLWFPSSLAAPSLIRLSDYPTPQLTHVPLAFAPEPSEGFGKQGVLGLGQIRVFLKDGLRLRPGFFYQLDVGDAPDELRLLVRKPRPVFIPNVFSPNNDGQNDILYIFGGRQVQRIQSFQIFNRWGEPVFEATDFPPNDFQYGWDGMHRGKPVNPGVFAYYVEVLYTDGYVELIKGEVSLVR